MFDLLIRGGMVIDGTGRAGFRADIAVENGVISAIEPHIRASAARIIAAESLTVTPGFIDIHRHADAAVFRPDFGTAELSQGLTTIVNGNCGLSLAPVPSAHRQEILSYLRPIIGAAEDRVPTETLYDYYAALPKLPLHIGMLCGGGTLRAGIAGYARQDLDAEQVHAIQRAMESALSDGALGVSLGLGYAPECFYSTRQLIELLRPIAHQDIPLTVHMRQEGGGVTESVQEMLCVARALHIPLHISHLKAMGRDNWRKKIPQALELLHRAQDEGMDVSCDVYPYTAGSTQLLHILPPEFLRGGMDAVVDRLSDPVARAELDRRIQSGDGFDNIAGLAGWDGIYLTSLRRPEHRCYLGKNLQEIAAMRGTTPMDSCCDLLAAERGEITMIDFMASEEDITEILKDPLSNVISDATYPTEGLLHPRVYGTFARFLEYFVQQKRILTLPEAIERITARPARALRLHGKGALAVGQDADINIFDPARIHETGSYSDPCHNAEGMDYVIVSGNVALESGRTTGCQAGNTVRRKYTCCSK